MIFSLLFFFFHFFTHRVLRIILLEVLTALTSLEAQLSLTMIKNEDLPCEVVPSLIISFFLFITQCGIQRKTRLF